MVLRASRQSGTPFTLEASERAVAVTWLWWTVHLGSAHARWSPTVALSFEQILVDGYQQLFNDSADVVKLDSVQQIAQQSRGTRSAYKRCVRSVAIQEFEPMP